VTEPGPYFVVLYRWKLRAGAEASFVEGWSRISRLLLEQRGSLGSRLHCGSDGLWYSYAQWPSAEARTKAFAAGPVDPAATEQMQAAIEERLPEIVLEACADFLVSPYDVESGYRSE
jgi:heme-degrading monooxygenase HmoA